MQAVNVELTQPAAVRRAVQDPAAPVGVGLSDHRQLAGEPASAGRPGAAAAGLTRTTADGPAALTQQLLTAQRSLPAAQNALLAIWINYMDNRLQLYRDLELMPLDARGVWIDKITRLRLRRSPARQPLPVPELLPTPVSRSGRSRFPQVDGGRAR